MKKFLSVLIVPLLFSSCTSVPHTTVLVPPVVPPAPVLSAPVPPPPVAVPIMTRRDVTHVLAPGETLPMLSTMYDVPVANIMAVNHLRRMKGVKMGQTLVIPRALPLRSVIPLFRSKKWKYIIIHHSATEEGDSLAFHGAHLKRGFVGGVGYHFVIDNGTLGKENGEIEATPRWLHQQDGRHCKASHMNTKAIGICLVGNFDKERVTEKQLETLVILVNTLRNFYKIPLKNIMEHGQVPGASTDCAGKNFPWPELTSRLRMPGPQNHLGRGKVL